MQQIPVHQIPSVRPNRWFHHRVQGVRVHPLLLLAAHVPLAMIMSLSSAVSTLHAVAALLVGLWVTLMDGRIERVAYVGAYFVGAEVLWRMTSASVPWEYSKYTIVLLFIIALARRSRLQGPMLPFLYFVLLLPSCALTLLNEDLGSVRERLSFNLSGPFTLMIASIFFSHLKLDAERLQWLRLAAIGPIMSIATITIVATMTNPDIVFTGESNNMTSGGYGPNQVSAALGLGALLILYFMLEAQASRLIRMALFCVMIFLATQSAMTFSRGGLYNAVGGTVMGFIFLAKDIRTLIKVMLMAIVLMILAIYIVIPKLDAFTDGAIIERFHNTDLTNRDNIIEADLRIWSEHPLFGVGPGEGTKYRRGAISHTEFSRMLSEHGFLGILSLAILLLAGLRVLVMARGPSARAVKSSMIVWSCLYMLSAAMRLAAPSFFFGLAFADLDSEDETD